MEENIKKNADLVVANVSAENNVVWRLLLVRGRSYSSIHTNGVLVALHGISIRWASRGLLKSCTMSVWFESVCTMNHRENINLSLVLAFIHIRA